MYTPTHGGYRSGAGRKKGSKLQRTLDKESAKENMEQYVLSKSEMLTNVLIKEALGEVFVYRRDPIVKKYTLVTDEKEIERAYDRIGVGCIDPKGEYIFITTKSPNVKAINYLLDRAFGKPKVSMEIEESKTLDLVALGRRAEELIAKRNEEYKSGSSK